MSFRRFNASGQLVNSSAYPSLAAADTAAVAGGYLLNIDKAWTLGAATTLSSAAVFGIKGIIATNTFNLTMNVFSAPLTKFFDCSAGGTVRFKGEYEAAYFGQVSDGVTDDAPALNATTASASPAGPRRIHLLPGVSIVNSTVTNYSQSNIEGDGWMQTFIRQPVSGGSAFYNIVESQNFETLSVLFTNSPSGTVPTRLSLKNLNVQSLNNSTLTTDTHGKGIGVALYGYSISIEDVSVGQCNSIGTYIEYQGVGPVTQSDWLNGYSPLIRGHRATLCLGGGFVYRGPNDMQLSQGFYALNGIRAAVTVTAGGSGYTNATATFSNGATGTVTLSGGAVSSVTVTALGSATYPITATISGDGTGATVTCSQWSIDGATNVWNQGHGLHCETSASPVYVGACQISDVHIFGNYATGFWTNSWVQINNGEIESCDGALAIFSSLSNSSTTQQSKLSNISFYKPNQQNYSGITAVTLSGSKHFWENCSFRADLPTGGVATPAALTCLLVSGLYNNIRNYFHDSIGNSTRANTAASITGNFNGLQGTFLNDTNSSSVAVSLGNIQGFDFDLNIINFTTGVNFTSASAVSGRLKVRGNINQGGGTQNMFAGTAPNALSNVHCDVEYRNNSVNWSNKNTFTFSVNAASTSVQGSSSQSHFCPWLPVTSDFTITVVGDPASVTIPSYTAVIKNLTGPSGATSGTFDYSIQFASGGNGTVTVVIQMASAV